MLLGRKHIRELVKFTPWCCCAIPSKATRKEQVGLDFLKLHIHHVAHVWDQSQMRITVSEVQLFAISVVQTCDSLPSYAHTIRHKAVLSAILGKTGCSSATKGRNWTLHTKHASSRLFEHSPSQEKKGKKRAGLRQVIEKVAIRRCLKTIMACAKKIWSSQ